MKPSPAVQFSGAQGLLATLGAIQPQAIAVYGLGVVAQNVLSALRQYRVVGLMDKDPSNRGRSWYGHVVLGDDDLSRLGVKAIVIAASDVYWGTIADRIAPLCRRLGIATVFLNGELAGKSTGELWAPLTDVVERTILDKEIVEHDVISFDLFETLVTRLVSRPDELLELAVARASAEAAAKEDLLHARKAAETKCRARWGAFTFSLTTIYDEMKSANGITERVGNALRCSELEVEEDLARPRRAMLQVLQESLAAGKEVCITTDTHLPRESLTAILRRCGLNDMPRLLVSWEEGGSKANGKLFSRLKDQYPKARIVHFGDQRDSDVQQANRSGVDACRIASPVECVLASRWRPVLTQARTTHDGVVTGLVARHLFEDPFARRLGDGRIEVASLRRFGYLFFGPLLLAWLGWLARMLRSRPADTVLFLAREGYLLTTLYNWLRIEADWHDLPEGIYFATSRRMAVVAALRARDDVASLLREDFSGSSEELLRLRCGLADNRGSSDDALTNTDPKTIPLLNQHMGRILANAASERERYLAYIERLGIKSSSRVALADLGIKGSIQDALQRMLGRALSGYYITGFFGASNPFGMHDNTFALFPGPSSMVYRYHILSESVLVAPHGMCLHIGPDGAVVHAPARMNQNLFAKKAEIHQGIREFVADWLSAGIDPASAQLSPGLIEWLFAQAMSETIALSDEVRSTFYVDELYRAATERRIWD